MHFLYPADMIAPRLPDEMFRDEADAMRAHGHTVSLVDSNTCRIDARGFEAACKPEASVVYRGWMLTPAEYQVLSDSVARQGRALRTSPEAYMSTHYLPHWYPLLADLTPETVVFDPAGDMVAALTTLGWGRVFIKDYVKSLKTAGGSVIEQPEEIGRVMAEMLQFRGIIEGGLCVRRFEEFVPCSERRFFVIDGVCHGPEPQAAIPAIVRQCAERLSSPFFSADVALRTDGVERLVEVGDGQVSDRVGWTHERFASLWDGL